MLETVTLQSELVSIELLLGLVLSLLPIAGFYMMLKKAGEPGWGVIPIINLYFLVKLSGRPVWWVILLFVPLVNFFVGILLHIDIAKKFGTGIGFGLGLTFLPIIFYPLVGFGDYQYQGGVSGTRQ